jgi:hypothetical protein
MVFKNAAITLMLLSFLPISTIQGCEPGVECGLVYDPVCGEDGGTYDNSCFAEKAGVESYTEGECAAGGASCEYTSVTLADGESVCDNPHQFTACDDGALMQGECAPDATCVEAGGIAECV